MIDYSSLSRTTHDSSLLADNDESCAASFIDHVVYQYSRNSIKFYTKVPWVTDAFINDNDNENPR